MGSISNKRDNNLRKVQYFFYQGGLRILKSIINKVFHSQTRNSIKRFIKLTRNFNAKTESDYFMNH